MAEDNDNSPLPRRVPGATDSPRPPTRIEQPVLAESVRQRLLMVIAKEQERASLEPEALRPEEQAADSQARLMAPDGTGAPQERTPPGEEKAPPERVATLGNAGSPRKVGHPEPTAPAEQFMPLPRQPPGANDAPTRPPAPSWDAVPAPPSVGRADALTEPFPGVSPSAKESSGAQVDLGVTEAAPRPERPAPVLDAPAAAVPDAPAATVSASNMRVAGQEQRRPGRRYRVAGVLISVAALIAVGSLALTLYGHSASAVAPRGHPQRPPSGDEQSAARDRAAAWVAAQVGPTTMVSADPAMCRVLESQGVSARDLYKLGPETTNPLRSAIIVATPAVRAQFGTLLNSVYAPAVLASFGIGRQRVDIREVAPRGAAAYRSMLAADLATRKSTAAELLRSNRITVSPTAREQLSAGQVDSRLQLTVAAMAAKRPIYIVAFNSFAPGADVNMPLRFADLIQASPGQLVGSRPVTPAFVRSMGALLRLQPASFRPLLVKTVLLARGQAVLRIGFAAPSPLGLFDSP
jgi:hypothetical protein